MGILLPFLCLVGIVAIFALGRFNSRNVKATQTTAEKKSTGGAGCGTWFLAFMGVIVSSLLLQSLYGGLLFLVVFLVMRMNPARDSQISVPPTDTEKNTAQRVYIWLFISPLLTVPCALTIIYGGFSDDVVLGSLIPLIFHIPLLLGLTSKSQFVFRHTQQGILLVGLRAGLAAFAFYYDALWLFILGNGALWLFGTLWERNQVIRGEYWWRMGKGGKIFPAGSTKASSPQMDKELKGLLNSLNAKDKLTAKDQALQSFRTGNSEVKKRAVEILMKLGEVEKF